MKVLYFAWLKTKTGVAEEEMTPPPGVSTVSDLIAHLRTLSPGHAAAFETLSVVRVAVNQDYGGLDTPIRDGDEIAFFPPVTGG